MSEVETESNPIEIQSSASFVLAQQFIQQIWKSFEQQVNTNNLIKHIPELINAQVYQLSLECVVFSYLLTTSQSSYNKRKNNNMSQDKMPTNICNDNIACFHLQIQQSTNSKIEFNGNPIDLRQLNQQKGEILTQAENNFSRPQQPNSLIYSTSKSHRNTNKKPNQNYSEFMNSGYFGTQIAQQKQAINNFNQQPSLTLHQQQLNTNELIPLNLDLKTEKINSALQSELEHMKKHLYIMRMHQKKNIQEEKANLEKLSKKNSRLFINKNMQHSYDYDGSLVDFKKSKEKNSFVREMNSNLPNNNDQKQKISSMKLRSMKSHSLNSSSVNLCKTPKRSSKFNLSQSLHQTNPQRNLALQQQLQKSSFSNGNKRQVSHLPFIILKDSSKIIENNKEISGSFTQRNSLYRSKISLNSPLNCKFKSFAQLEQEKRVQKQVQKELDVTETQELLQLDIMPPTLNLNNINSQPLRKQSRMMQKYLKKITEQKSRIDKMMQKDNGLKSLNFQQVMVPQKYPIQRYYEYDYDEEKRSHQYSISSKISTKRNSISVVNQTEPI